MSAGRDARLAEQAREWLDLCNGLGKTTMVEEAERLIAALLSERDAAVARAEHAEQALRRARVSLLSAIEDAMVLREEAAPIDGLPAGLVLSLTTLHSEIGAALSGKDTER